MNIIIAISLILTGTVIIMKSSKSDFPKEIILSSNQRIETIDGKKYVTTMGYNFDISEPIKGNPRIIGNQAGAYWPHLKKEEVKV